MKAVILVGGYGTRLRPLTLSVPKPLINFCNRPIIEYHVRALQQVGVDHIILAVAYQPEAMQEALRALEQRYKVKISLSVEEEPLMTAGPLRLASDLLHEDTPDEEHPELFFTLNSDVICEFPFAAMKSVHLKHQKEGTICITKVKDPSRCGVVLTNPQTHLIEGFVEKPKEWIGDTVNAGLYLFNRSIIKRIEPRPCTLEREIFPEMCRDKQLYALNLEGYWADIGRPADFLEGTKLYLTALKQKIEEESAAKTEQVDKFNQQLGLLSGPTIIGSVLVHPSATIGEDCLIGPDVTIGANCVIGRGVRLSRCSLMADVVVQDFARIDNSIVGWQCRIGKWVHLVELTVLGQDVTVKNECVINGAFVLPYKSITDSIWSPGAIIM